MAGSSPPVAPGSTPPARAESPLVPGPWLLAVFAYLLGAVLALGSLSLLRGEGLRWDARPTQTALTVMIGFLVATVALPFVRVAAWRIRRHRRRDRPIGDGVGAFLLVLLAVVVAGVAFYMPWLPSPPRGYGTAADSAERAIATLAVSVLLAGLSR